MRAKRANVLADRSPRVHAYVFVCSESENYHIWLKILQIYDVHCSVLFQFQTKWKWILVTFFCWVTSIRLRSLSYTYLMGFCVLFCSTLNELFTFIRMKYINFSNSIAKMSIVCFCCRSLLMKMYIFYMKEDLCNRFTIQPIQREKHLKTWDQHEIAKNVHQIE